MKDETTYRDRFKSVDNVHSYEFGQYAAGSYGELLWRIERECLQHIIDEYRSTQPVLEYLDFATGTGRIISFVEKMVGCATGIEISNEMAAVARRKVSSSKIICCDITNKDCAIEGKYDLITAFRFFLNAEQVLRMATFRALAGRLRDSNSILIFNNHGNLWSYRLLAWPYYCLKGIQQNAWRPNYLSHSQVLSMVEQSGMEVVRVIGCGVFSGKLAKVLAFEKALNLEKWAARHRFLSRFGANQIYIARLK
jgi:predicted TPR repeat methyltransferase